MKQPGLCSLCDKPVFEIIAKYPQGHEKEGQVCKIGSPMDDALRVEFILDDGTTAQVTFCTKCELSAGNIRKTWDRIFDCIHQEAGKPIAYPVGILNRIPWTNYA